MHAHDFNKILTTALVYGEQIYLSIDTCKEYIML